jgi:hypothetical protein
VHFSSLSYPKLISETGLFQDSYTVGCILKLSEQYGVKR